MNILYTLNSGMPGGMEQHVLYLVKGMVAKGHTVHVWCKSGEIADWFAQAGAKVTISRIKFDIDLVYISALTHYLKENKIDVAHSHELKAVINTLIACNNAGTPVRITHTHTPISEWPVHGLLGKIIRGAQIKFYSIFINKYASCEIALTKSREVTKIAEGIKATKLEIVPNCFNSQAFFVDSDSRREYRLHIRQKYALAQDSLVFTMVSRLSEEKNQKYLIEAFAGMSLPESKNARLLLAGGGNLEPELRDMLRARGLESQVVITGVFAQEDLPKLYFASDVFVFPSKAEGFGLVLTEALAAELPVLASDLEVLREVGADTVDYFPINDVAYLTKMLEGYVKYFDQNHSIPLNTKGRERVARLYTEKAFADAYEKLYVQKRKLN